MDALGNGSTLARVPLFVAALLAVRALPAVIYRGSVENMELGLLSEANGAALVAAGLVSVLIFPSAALSVLRGRMATVRMPPAAEVQ